MNISIGDPGYLSIHGGQYRNVVVIMVMPACRTRKYAVIDNAVDRCPVLAIGRDIHDGLRGISLIRRRENGERELMEIRDDIIRRCELHTQARSGFTRLR